MKGNEQRFAGQPWKREGLATAGFYSGVRASLVVSQGSHKQTDTSADSKPEYSVWVMMQHHVPDYVDMWKLKNCCKLAVSLV